MVEAKPFRLGARTLWAVALRSFFLQACWNFQRMQNLGFAFAMIPAIRRLAKTPEQKIMYLKRHLEFFNTHPYCASVILGVVCKIEEEHVLAGEQESDMANRLKAGMMGPLAALGDTVFWAMLKPAAALVGAGLVWFSAGGKPWTGLWGPALFLLLFSIPHLAVRLGGIFLGYRRGLEVVKDLRRYNPQLIARKIGLFMAIAAAAAAAVYMFQKSQALPFSPWAGSLLFAGILAIFIWVLQRGVPMAYLFYFLLGACTLLAYCGIL